MPITLDGSNGITTPTYGGADTSEYLVPVTQFKNRIINGAMVIDQRNAGASVTPTTSNNVFSVDRWLCNASQATKYTVQQNAGSVTPPVGFTNYMGVTSSSAYSITSSDYFFLEQDIEGLNCGDLSWGTANAQTVTVSFWVRSSLTGTFGASLRNSSGGRSYPFSYTINAANTWEQKSITIAGDTSGTWLTTNGIGIRLSFSIGSGSNWAGTANAWNSDNDWTVPSAVSVVGTNGATFYITGVQLEVGSTATSFDYRPYGTELQLCMRYYEKSYDIATTPSTSTTTNACKYVSPRTVNPSAPDDIFSVPYIVSKRATPTITIYSTTGASGNVRDISNSADVASGGTTAGENSYSLRWSMTDTRFYAWQWAASSEL